MPYVISDDAAKKISAMWQWIHNLRVVGGNLKNTPTGATLTIPPQRVAHEGMGNRVSVAGVFPVKVTQTGGSNGNASAAATYTYTVKNIAGDSIGTAIALARPRPYGKVTVQSADGYGIAFWGSDGLLKLWDAGEIPDTATCA